MYVALIMFIVFGFTSGVTVEDTTPYFADGAMGFLMSVAIMSFTYTGATNIINLSAEAGAVSLGAIAQRIMSNSLYNSRFLYWFNLFLLI